MMSLLSFSLDGLFLKMYFIYTVAPVITLALKSCRNVISSAVSRHSLSAPCWRASPYLWLLSFYTFLPQVFWFVFEQLKSSWFNLLMEWKSILFRANFPLYQLGEPIPLMTCSNYLINSESSGSICSLGKPGPFALCLCSWLYPGLPVLGRCGTSMMACSVVIYFHVSMPIQYFFYSCRHLATT